MTCADIMALKGSDASTTPSSIVAFANHLEQCPTCKEMVTKHSDEVDQKQTNEQKLAIRMEAFAAYLETIKSIRADPENQQIPERWRKLGGSL